MATGIDFRDLHCRKIGIEISVWVHKKCIASGVAPDDELAMRWNIAAMNIPGKIAFAYGPESTERLIEWLPVAVKYSAETAFWSRLAHEQGMINKNELYMLEEQIGRVIKKVSSIVKYLEKYGKEEEYKWKLMFKKDVE